MRTFNDAYAKLRKHERKNYILLTVCMFISILLIASFSVMMQSNTVQNMLPEGGDSRKQMVMIFALAIVGCAVFTTYASTLFFRSKSRETGVFMALGASKKQIRGLLFRDLGRIAAGTAVAGVALGTPLAAGIWQIFGLFIKSQDMVFSINALGYLWPVLFAAFTTLCLFLQGSAFIRRSNIIDIVNEQRKSEPVRDVKPWVGLLGIILMVGGGFGALALPSIFAAAGRTTPLWVNALYVVLFIGLYLLLIYIVVHGTGGKKQYYKTIITRSMMKFQGKQTVLNMCVISVLVMGAFFALFYAPMTLTSAMARFESRPVDYAFHHRADETGIPSQKGIEALAAEENISMHGYGEAELINLATDGYDREPTEDGQFGNTYHEFYQEETFIRASEFTRLTGIPATVGTGEYLFIAPPNFSPSPYDYQDLLQKFTNPDTMQSMPVQYAGQVEYEPMERTYILSDGDYETLRQGLTIDWQEKYVQFDVDNADETYDFAKRLRNAIIDGSSEKSAVSSLYDHVERINAEAEGIIYRGGAAEMDYATRDSSDFNQYWRYIPKFRVLDSNDFVMNMSVFLMLFIFIAIICFAAVIVIAYTRCITIALLNRQVYDDLRHLGANNSYLYNAVRGQVSKVFSIPMAIGSVVIMGYFIAIMYFNSGGIDPGELRSIGINLVLVAAVGMIMWGIYRRTLRKICKMLGVSKPVPVMKPQAQAEPVLER